MGILLLVLVVALVFAGVGIAYHLLWVVAALLFVGWLAGLALGVGRRNGASGRRQRSDLASEPLQRSVGALVKTKRRMS